MPRFTELVMDHFQEPRNVGTLESPDLVGMAGVPGKGRYVLLHVALTDSRDHIQKARFRSHGCGPTIACASVLTELIQGQSLSACQALQAADLTAALGGLPADRQHCAEFVIRALRSALDGLADSKTRMDAS